LKIIELQLIINSKDEEIERLKKSNSGTIIQQFDGIDCDENLSDSSKPIESESSDEESNSKPVFECDICEYLTESKHGLKVHMGKQHTYKCDSCALGFNNKESLNRHREAKSILSNIDPFESPDHSKKLIIGEKDETCLDVFDNLLDKNVALLHSDECWGRHGHSCKVLPDDEPD
jgi:hypothetical protein